MTAITLRRATKADVEAMRLELPYRIRAFAAELDGKLLGLGGLVFLPNDAVGAFLALAEGARRYKLALHKAGLRTMAEARALGLRRVVALADPEVPPAERWLERLGFRAETVGGDTAYVWEG